MNLADRLTALQRLADAKGVNIDTHVSAIERRVRSVEARLHERAVPEVERPS